MTETVFIILPRQEIEPRIFGFEFTLHLITTDQLIISQPLKKKKKSNEKQAQYSLGLEGKKNDFKEISGK